MNDYYDSETFENLQFVGDECVSDEFYGCTFKNCLFDNSFINDCAFSECKFYDCTFKSMTFMDCEVHLCEFYDSNLIGINWDDFTDGQRDGFADPIEKMENCLCKSNVFPGLNFAKCNFKKSQIIESSFLNCNLKEADFNSCNLDNTTFSDCECSKADFRNSTGWVIPLTSNSIKGARFSFPEVVNLLNGLGIRWE